MKYPPGIPPIPQHPFGDLVCFKSAFVYEGADNITHLTLDGEKTACGRRNWVTSEGWHANGPDCLRCRIAWNRLPASERTGSSRGGAA